MMKKVTANCPQPIWTNAGWLKLTGVYDVNDEFLPVAEFDDEHFCATIIVDEPNDSPLSKVLGVNIRFINVNKAHFDEL